MKCFSVNKSTCYLSLCLTEFFLQWDIKNLSFIRSLNQVHLEVRAGKWMRYTWPRVSLIVPILVWCYGVHSVLSPLCIRNSILPTVKNLASIASIYITSIFTYLLSLRISKSSFRIVQSCCLKYIYIEREDTFRIWRKFMEPGLENVQERETTVRPTVLVKLQTIPERILLPHTVRAWYYNFSFHWTWDSAAVCHQSGFASVSASNPCLCLLCSGLISLTWPQFISFTQSCLTLCDPMNCSMPGLPVYHQLLEFTQTHVHQVGDAIQPPHPLSSPSAPSPSQHQGLFQWVNSSYEVAKVLD